MTCPTCGAQGAYQGLSKIECLNNACAHYSEAWANENKPKPKEPVPLVDEGGYPLEPADGWSGGPSSPGDVTVTLNQSPVRAFALGGRAYVLHQGETLYRKDFPGLHGKTETIYWVCRNGKPYAFTDMFWDRETIILTETELQADPNVTRLA